MILGRLDLRVRAWLRGEDVWLFGMKKKMPNSFDEELGRLACASGRMKQCLSSYFFVVFVCLII